MKTNLTTQIEEKKIMTIINEEKKEIKILLIEDNPGDVRLIREYLNNNNGFDFNIVHAKSMQEAMSIITNEGAEFFNVFDAVLLDLGLPDCVGMQTFQKIKDKLPAVPIIVLTGSILERNDLRNCFEAAHYFLYKGYIDSTSLINSITNSMKKEKDRENIIKMISNKK